MFAVIVENDQSEWSDDTGALYHFPKRYRATLAPGTRVIYYKGKLRDATFARLRLTSEPHYFGKGVIGSVYIDSQSSKGDFFAIIEDYEPFENAVPIRVAANLFEEIPASRVTNYWRDGVRSISGETYAAILSAAGVSATSEVDPGAQLAANPSTDDDLSSDLEGSRTLRFVATYERVPKYRRQALALHGYCCKACDLDMGALYGPYAEGLIHFHHVVPVSSFDVPRKIDPTFELMPVCPNCHAVIHRRKSSTLSIAEVRKLLGKVTP